MAYEIVWSNHAKNELQNTIDYLIQNWSEKEVMKLAQMLENVIQHLGANPYIFQASISHPYLHRAIILRYNTLYFRVNGNRVEIVSFFSNRQSPLKRKILETP